MNYENISLGGRKDRTVPLLASSLLLLFVSVCHDILTSLSINPEDYDGNIIIGSKSAGKYK